MKPTCEFEAMVADAVRGGASLDALSHDVNACSSCREVRDVTRVLCATEHDVSTSAIRNPDSLWVAAMLRREVRGESLHVRFLRMSRLLTGGAMAAWLVVVVAGSRPAVDSIRRQLLELVSPASVSALDGAALLIILAAFAVAAAAFADHVSPDL